MVTPGHRPVAAFLIDQTGRVGSWSKECERLLGYRADEILAQPYQILLVKKGPARSHEPIPESVLWRARCMRHKNGQPVPVRLVLQPQTSEENGTTICIALILPVRTARRQHQVRKFINRLPGTFYVVDEQGYFLLWNQSFSKIVGKTSRQLAKSFVMECFDSKDRMTVSKALQEAMMHGNSLVEVNVITKSGAVVPYIFSCSRMLLNRKYCICGIGVEIAQRKGYEEMLRLRERAIQASFSGVVITRCTEHGNLIEYVNPAFERITGYTEQEVLGRDPRFMRLDDVDHSQTEKMRMALRMHEGTHVIMRNVRKNGEIFWNDLKIDPVVNTEGKVTHYVGVMTDITELKQSEKHLAYLASHDELTGLANRSLMREHLELAIMQAHRYRTLVALVFIDVDKLKTINDTLGHDAGDEVLKTIAARLRVNVRESDIVARLHGDEFVVVLANQPNIASITDLVDRLHHNVCEAIPHISESLMPSISAGIAIYPHDGKTVEGLMHNADVAMYHAKSLGRHNYQFYSSELHAAANQRLQEESQLRQALAQGQFFLLFQPRIDCRTGTIIGAEALVRWQHPEKGVVTPDFFLPLAEETGLITAIGDWVLQKACKAIRHFHAMGLPTFTISVNLSARQLKQKGFIDNVAHQLARAAVPPGCLELELTENQLMDNPEHMAQALHQLKALGVRIAIDDFGSGFSSLSYLEKLPIDHLKIDAAFVHGIGQGEKDLAIAKAVIALGHSLKARVIAEGVETESQYRSLRQHDCDEMQGYYFSEPIIVRPLKAMIRKSGLLPH